MVAVPLSVVCYSAMRLLHLVVVHLMFVVAAVCFGLRLHMMLLMVVRAGQIQHQVIIASEIYMQTCGFGLAIQSAAEYAGYNGDLYDYFFHGLCVCLLFLLQELHAPYIW